MPRKTDDPGRAIPGLTRFNEAAARCRGKRPDRPDNDLRTTSFNEAAARCRGKRVNPDHLYAGTQTLQ